MILMAACPCRIWGRLEPKTGCQKPLAQDEYVAETG